MKTEWIESLAGLLSYCAETGVFRWRAKPAKNVSVGSIAGSLRSNGYIVIGYRGRHYLAHRIAWFMLSNALPCGEIDHINGVRDDNRASNLRDVSRRKNAENIRKAKPSNKTGLLGVHRHEKSGKYRASIFSNGRTIHLGLFDHAESAHEAYVRAKRRIHAGGTI